MRVVVKITRMLQIATVLDRNRDEFGHHLICYFTSCVILVSDVSDYFQLQVLCHPLSSQSTLERTDNAVSGLISTNGGFNFGSGSVDYVYVSNQYLIILRYARKVVVTGTMGITLNTLKVSLLFT